MKKIGSVGSICYAKCILISVFNRILEVTDLLAQATKSSSPDLVATIQQITLPNGRLLLLEGVERIHDLVVINYLFLR